MFWPGCLSVIALARIADRGPFSAASLAAGLLLAPLWLSVLAATGGTTGLLLLVSVFAMICIIASAAVVTFVALRRGEAAAAKVFGVCVLMLLVVSLLLKGSAFQALLVAVTIWLPPILGGFVLARTVSLPLAVMTVGICSAVAVVVISLVLGDTTEFWRTQFNEVISVANQQGMSAALPTSEAQMEQFVTGLNSRIILSIGITVLSLSLGALFLARSWQAALFNPGGFQKEFHQLSLGRNASVACLAIVAVCLLIGGDEPRAIALVFISVLATQGLAIVHALVKQRSMHRFWLHGVYLMIMLLPVILLLAALGVADNAMPLRQKKEQ